MSPADLMAEANAYARNLRGHFDHLAKLGVLTGLATIGQRQPPAGLAKVRHAKAGLWEPDEGGVLEMTVPVAIPVTIDPFELPIETIEIVDIVAFSSRSPAQWRWRTAAAWALGEELITEPTDQPVRIVSTPLAWLREGGKAACILDWSASSPAWQHLRTGPDLVVPNSQLRKKLAKALQRTVRLPAMRSDHAAA